MKGKKAVTFEFGIVIATVVITVFALYSIALKSNERIQELSSPLTVLNIQAEAQEALFYLEESAKLSGQDASFLLLQNLPTNGECSKLSDVDGALVLVFDSACSLSGEQEISEKLLKDFDSFFKNYILEYKSTWKRLPEQEGLSEEAFSGVLSKQNLDNYNYNLDGKMLVGSAKESITYSLPPVKIEVDPSFSFELPFSLSELNGVYEQSKSAISSCRSASEIVKCVQDKIKLDSFDIQASKQGNFIFFEVATKQKYFYKDNELKFDKLKLNYAFHLSGG